MGESHLSQKNGWLSPSTFSTRPSFTRSKERSRGVRKVVVVFANLQEAVERKEEDTTHLFELHELTEGE